MARGQHPLGLSCALGAHHTHPPPRVVEGGKQEVFCFHAFPYGGFGGTWRHDAPAHDVDNGRRDIIGCVRLCYDRVL